jgi:hypothetical protein
MGRTIERASHAEKRFAKAPRGETRRLRSGWRNTSLMLGVEKKTVWDALCVCCNGRVKKRERISFSVSLCLCGESSCGVLVVNDGSTS